MYIPKTTECKCNNCGILFQKTIKSLKQCAERGATEVYCTMKCFHAFIKRKMVVVNCDYCKNDFELMIGKYNTSKKLGLKAFYCNRECHANSLKNKIKLKCENCNLEFERIPSQINNHNYCSRKCKDLANFIVNRSQLEIYLENKVKEYFPYVNMLCSDRIECRNLELDFYFPDLKLAIEINGIFHYEPKFGEERLNIIQHNDKGKKFICYKKGIELHIIKSIENYAQKGIKERDWKIFKNILMSKIPFCETEDDCISSLYDNVSI